jgi:UDP-N-acetylenolpyruvoylglucosamine reductase
VHGFANGQAALDGLLDWVDVVRPGTPVLRIDVAKFKRDRNHGELDVARSIVIRARLQLTGSEPKVDEFSDGVRVRRIPHRPRVAAPAFLTASGDRADGLLQRAQCSGLAAGGARLSHRDPNCICTSRSSRAGEVQRLVRAVIDRVADRTGEEIRTALWFVDEEGSVFQP